MRNCLLLFTGLLLTCLLQAQSHSFTVVPLGVRGGIDESNLSAYLVAPAGTADYICFDAGTIHAGIEKAIASNAFKTTAATVLKQYIKGYFISHAHLDHCAGLIINSPDDSLKSIYALQSVTTMLQNNYFNGQAWANFGDAGKGFALKKYHFETLQPGIEDSIRNTAMTVSAFSLSHVNPYESTAFLVKSGEGYVLYLGDTGADENEKSDKLQLLWKEIAPLIAAKKLKGIFIEVSFPDEQPANKLFGHLTPALLIKELQKLSSLAGAGSLNNFRVVITHMKPPVNNYAIIQKQLLKQNTAGVKFIFPIQGKAFGL
jgi:3',5'-cyclic-nucleotide phosphodiesterase